MKKIFIVATIMILTTGILTNALETSKSLPIKNNRQRTGLEKLPDTRVYPAQPGAALVIDTVGTTYYEFQTNGSPGDRIIAHTDGSVHICWTNLLDWPYPPSPRHVYYAYKDVQGTWSEPMQVSQNNPAGFCQMSGIFETHASIAYHETYDSNPTYVTLASEHDPIGFGFFNYFDTPDQLYPQTPESPGQLYWPYVTVDRNNNIHVVASENTDRRLQRMAYTFSSDSGATWSALRLVDTVMVIGSVMDASPVSDRVVLAYCDPNDTTTQWNNDIVYFVSEDGYSWNWRYGKQNVTNYATDDDSLWAYTDCDVIIDYNDDIHLVWNASRIDSDGYIEWKTFLFHYAEDTGEITQITHHPDSLFADICGTWNRPICKMSLSCNSYFTDAIEVSWTQFDTADVSMGGFGNGDIWMACSHDGGLSWPIIRNITSTSSPDCYPGECMSENWGTLADEFDSFPYFEYQMTYILDKDAGSAIEPEGSPTENFVVYDWDIVSGIDDPVNLPENYHLAQNYPNPFNAKTQISFNLEKPSRTTIDIYDITGTRVCSLLDDDLQSGTHNATWDATGFASGVYFYKINTEDFSETKRAILIK